MKLEELKKMIKEEFDAFIEEAEDDVNVDVDADEAAADKNPEDTLKKVFDMLKDYFEGDMEDEMGDEMADDMGEDGMMDEVKDDDMKNEDADLEEASSTGFGDAGAKNTSGKDSGYTPAKTTKGDGKLHESKSALQERFKKLANIIK